DLLAGRSLDLSDYESSRSFFEESDGSAQLVQRIVSALMRLPRADDALSQKIERDALQRGWSRAAVPIEALASCLGDILAGAVPTGEHSGCSFGDHQFHCLRRGALALALRFRERLSGHVATVMLYAFRYGDGYLIVTSSAI